MSTLRKVIKVIGILSILLGLAIALVQFFPLIKAEALYQWRKYNNEPAPDVTLNSNLTPKTEEIKEKNYIIPEDKEFGLVIPSIGINISVVPEVDPFNSQEYQVALAKGVAHARNTALPTQNGNTVIFAHSSDNFYNANRYNAIFYLLNKLEGGDKMYLTYQNKLYEYELIQKGIVQPEEMQYMEPSEKSKLTLITCWPPGTTFKRLVVVAE